MENIDLLFVEWLIDEKHVNKEQFLSMNFEDQLKLKSEYLKLKKDNA